MRATDPNETLSPDAPSGAPAGPPPSPAPRAPAPPGSIPADPAFQQAGAAAPPDPAHITASGAASGTASWADALGEEQRALVQAKGWKSPADALESYRSLEKTLGQDKVALPPLQEDGSRDFTDWEGFAKLGRPETPEDYRFTLPEGTQLSDADRALQEALRPHLHKAGLTQQQLDLLTPAFSAANQSILAAFADEVEQQNAAAAAELRHVWGSGYDAKMAQAQQVVAHFGGAELAAELNDSVLGSHPKLALALQRIGAAIGETGPLPAGQAAPSGLTPASAQMEIDRIMAAAARDPKHPYMDRLHPEHQAMQQRMSQLFQVAARGRAGQGRAGQGRQG